jgi:16S rRNA (uracil1498-N3)-methyltransferase
MTFRLHISERLQVGPLNLPDDAARHAQVLRLQPGMPLVLFDGHGGQWSARIESMQRSGAKVRVHVHVLTHMPVECEAALSVHLAVVVPTNDRMDALVEKAGELGAVSITPLLSSRSVLRLDDPVRAERRRAHWQGVAVAASTQCGRNRITSIEPVQSLLTWLQDQRVPTPPGRCRWLLSTRDTASITPTLARPASASVTLLSGPEGGFTSDEEAAAWARGFVGLSLGPRILRADTAPLAALAAWVVEPKPLAQPV